MIKIRSPIKHFLSVSTLGQALYLGPGTQSWQPTLKKLPFQGRQARWSPTTGKCAKGHEQRCTTSRRGAEKAWGRQENLYLLNICWLIFRTSFTFWFILDSTLDLGHACLSCICCLGIMAVTAWTAYGAIIGPNSEKKEILGEMSEIPSIPSNCWGLFYRTLKFLKKYNIS